MLIRRFPAVLALALVFLWSAVPVRAAGEAQALSEALHLPELFDIMQDEGAAYGASLEEEMFPGTGGAGWTATVADIYAPDRLLQAFQPVFAEELLRTGADPAPMLAFFTSPLGQRVVTLEVSARRALLDPSVEEASRLKVEEMRAAGEPRMVLVETFVEVNDLVEANVIGGLNANYAFYRGLADAGAMGADISEPEMIGDVWSQEEEIRAETDVWIHAYLALAYAPLSDEELQAYIDFSGLPEGRALNRALFAGYDRIFVEVSRQLGQAAGRLMASEDL